MLPFFNQARARQRATTAQSVAHQVLHFHLSLPRSINLFALRPRHLTPLNVPTRLPPFPSYCSSAATPAVCLPISRFLNSFLLCPLSPSLSLPLYLSLDAHFCLSARINFNGPHTPHAAAPQPVPPAHLCSFSLSSPFFSFFFYCPWSSAIHPFLGSFARALAFVMSAGECECEGRRRRRRRVCLHITHTPRCVALTPAVAAVACRARRL